MLRLVQQLRISNGHVVWGRHLGTEVGIWGFAPQKLSDFCNCESEFWGLYKRRFRRWRGAKVKLVRADSAGLLL